MIQGQRSLFEVAESGTPVIGPTYAIFSTVVIVHWLGNFASRVEHDGTLKMDFRVELHSQEAKRRQREIP